jgi:hypothetical protein
MQALLGLLSSQETNPIYRLFHRRLEQDSGDDDQSSTTDASSIDPTVLTEEGDDSRNHMEGDDSQTNILETTDTTLDRASLDSPANDSRLSSSPIQNETYRGDRHTSMQEPHDETSAGLDVEMSEQYCDDDAYDYFAPNLDHPPSGEESEKLVTIESPSVNPIAIDREEKSMPRDESKEDRKVATTAQDRLEVSTLSECKPGYICSDGLILYASTHNIHLLDPHLNCLASLHHVIPENVPLSPVLSQFDRLSFMQYIPEVSLVVVASQSGHVSLLRLVRYASEKRKDASLPKTINDSDGQDTKERYAFIREHQLPTHSRYPTTPLIGLNIVKFSPSTSFPRRPSFSRQDDFACASLKTRRPSSVQIDSPNSTDMIDESLTCFRLYLVYYDFTFCCYELRRSPTSWEFSSIHT